MELVDKIPMFAQTISENSHNLTGFFMVGVFVLSITIFSIMSYIFVFHWRKYGDGGKYVKTAEWVFVFGGIAFLCMMGLSLISFFI